MSNAVAEIRKNLHPVEKIFMDPARIMRADELLPKHVEAESYMRAACNAVLADNNLSKCTERSLVQSVMKAAELGLYVNGVQGHAYIIPYKNQATLQIGYKGWVELCYRTGQVDSISGHVVCQNDDFDFAYGDRPFIVHRPNLGERGEPKAYYCAVRLKGTEQPIIHVMGRPDVEKHRDKYSPAWKKQSSSPWKTDFDAMAIKTCFLQLVRWLPKSKDFLQVHKAEAIDVSGSREIDPKKMGLNDYDPSDPIDTTATDPELDELAGEMPGDEPQDEIPFGDEDDRYASA